GVRPAPARTCARVGHGRLRRVVCRQAGISASGIDCAGVVDRHLTDRMMADLPFTTLVGIGVGTPAILLTVLGVASLVDRPFPERWTGPLAGSAMMLSFVALVAALVFHGASATGPRLLSYGAWSTSHQGGIAIEFLVDRLSLAFAALSAAIAG